MPEPAGLIHSLLSPRSCPDPYDVYRALRRDGRVHHFTPLNMFLVNGYADCAALHRDRGLLVMDSALHEERRLGRWPQQVLHSIDQWPVYRNPPAHAASRQVLKRHFAPAVVDGLRPVVERQYERELAEVVRRGANGAVVDLQPHLERLPMMVMSTVLGLPPADLPRLVEVVAEFSLFFEVVLTGGQKRRMVDGHDRLIAYFLDVIAERRRRPDGAVVSHLVAELTGPGGTLSDRRLAGMLAGLLLAGFETTVGLLGNGAHALATHPEQARLLAAEPERADAAVEEVLRWDSPVQVNSRVAGRRLDVAGVPIPIGAVVALVYGSAHRDPDRYPDPDRFDITRPGARSLSFGTGIHHCLGSRLARMEAAVAFACLARFPALRLAGKPKRRSPGFTIRAFETLPVKVS
ncbi:cytochrome P450 [Saccharothrix longispora]|uniref:Cytochrome P450 n=1 Tax=Saccharothrix longispora TaxID=33920 RepID=A0ABU1PPJ5_9PSEU|nr:cytochrome P450 [Saccharothrix longispora]MDR6592587.1 cytochrome P450 [Saccharothrix longispora]